MAAALIFKNRTFSPSDLQLIREVVASCGA